MSAGLVEKEMPDTRKFSKYRKVYYSYPQLEGIGRSGAVKPGQIQLEIVSFANPYPFHRAQIGSLLRDYLLKEKREDIIQAYGLEAFDVNVLDIRRTATEKLVSLFRHSLADDYPSELRAKIRHFYDLHYLWQDTGCREYLQTPEFRKDFDNLFSEDQARFAEPIGWQNRVLTDSPLLNDFAGVWNDLKTVYESELPELAFREIPKQEEIFLSFSSLLSIINRN